MRRGSAAIHRARTCKERKKWKFFVFVFRFFAQSRGSGRIRNDDDLIVDLLILKYRKVTQVAGN